MIGILAAAALMALVQAPPTQQGPPAPQDAPATQLEDVTVTGHTLDELIGKFVNEVAEPNHYRGLARWDRSICVGVANLRPEPAQYIVDRVSTVAENLGLAAGAPGCTANLLIIATDDGGEMARTLVENRLRSFYTGGGGTDRGLGALADFQRIDRPIRWWQISMPTDSASGQIATRLPGYCDNMCYEDRPTSFAPQIHIEGASRLRTQIVDNIFRTIVIVDVDEVADLTIQQLADYIAMVSLAQIDPDADTSAYASILNVFEDGETSPTLTGWDLAYLDGLYRAEQRNLNRASGRSEVESSIRRAHAGARADQTEE